MPSMLLNDVFISTWTQLLGAAAKLQCHARVGTAFGYMTHDQLQDTHSHILPYSAAGVNCLDPHIMADILTIYRGLPSL